eukprot:TRINITY_DN39146_c0_g1_i1.p1 TRINITY_DN39146_c0_g1~~TRINITY_DN39146_c0_g1_i1.p1  ORF type:complete len:497 (-),score=82.05 TRINITY_DN39146_c0_g1_i1:273-1604(-)
MGGRGGLCFSTKRFEVGEGMCDDGDNCICVRPGSSKGSVAKGGQSANNEQGAEIRMGSFLTHKADICTECGQHDQDRAVCDSCKNCEYMTKTVEVPDGKGGTYDREQQGCFQRTQGAGSDVNTPVYANGTQTEEKEMKLIPHYPLWDPREPPELDDDAPTLRMPFSSRREPLGREEWKRQYKFAAPAMQKAMDILVMRLKDGTRQSGPWAELADEDSGLRRPGLHRCWTRIAAGDNISGKVDKFLNAQQVCKRMQETAMRIAPGLIFASKENACGAFSWDKGQQIWTCGCHRGLGRNIKNCVALNCYNDDPDVLEAIEALRQKMKICAGAGAMSEAEVFAKGQPEPVGSMEVTLAGKVAKAELAVPALLVRDLPTAVGGAAAAASPCQRFGERRRYAAAARHGAVRLRGSPRRQCASRGCRCRVSERVPVDRVAAHAALRSFL